jgi:hypothetical protein
MMAAIYLAMLAALGLAWARRKGLAIAAAAVCFALATHLFLWEIWSPETGFRTPRLDVRLDTTAGTAA